MNLDKQVNWIRENALVTCSLDGKERCFYKYGDIYNDIMEEMKKFRNASAVQSETVISLPYNTVVDINELLSYDGREFVQNAYMKILGRKPEQEGLQANLNSLQNGGVSKQELLQQIACSEEAKLRGTLLTGFKKLDVSEFMQYHEHAFVDMAYVLILGRHADSYGLEHYLKLLMVGEISKEEVLYAIKNSPEGAGRELEIEGLDPLYRKRIQKRRVLNIPIVGKCARWALNLRHANRRIKTLTLREYETEKTLLELRYHNDGNREKLEKIGYRVAESTERLESFDGQINKVMEENLIVRACVDEVADRVEEVAYCVEESRGRVEEVNAHVEEVGKHVDEIESCTDGIIVRVDEITGRVDEVAGRINEVGGQMEDTQSHLKELHTATSQIGANVNDINSALEGIGSNVHDINEALGNYDKIIGEYVREDKKVIQMLLTEVYTLKAKLNALEQKGITVQTAGEVALPEMPNDSYTSIDYFDFENHFRGSREHVKSVQAMYLPYYEGKKNVLDLGCGRGEFTEMLVEQNVGVTGVDQYAPYVEYMKALNLPVVHDDAIHYLRKQEKVDGIFVGQVVEHISTEQIMELCNLAYEKLEDGAYFIMETPNPTSLAIYTQCFYMDPSHQKPVHPQTLKYMAEKAGFSDVEILYTQASRMPYEIPKLKENDEDFREFNEAMGKVSDLLYGSQDYAIIARR